MTQSVHSTLSSKSSSAATAASSISITKRQFSSNEDTKIHTIGGKEYDDLKQIRLVQLPSHKNNQKPTTLASICVKRNIIFGPKLIHLNDKGFVKTLSPLLKQAFDQASVEGDQPQGLAALDGLAHYVTLAMQEDGPIVSPILEQLKKEAAQHQQQQQLILQESQASPATYTDDGSERASVQDAQLVLEAVYSVATQMPRQNHSVVGMGTYTDARRGWSMLAKEYAQYNRNHEYCKHKLIREGDAQLFQKHGGVFVNVEYIGDENPQYWEDAGGSMARFFFM
eukprot:scaffold2090_cov151-Chaetoceros_neogracile.AAC.7